MGCCISKERELEYLRRYPTITYDEETRQYVYTNKNKYHIDLSNTDQFVKALI
jgi:hypothetical protein